MPHIMKPLKSKADHDKNPIGILQMMTNDKTVKPQEVFEGFKQPKQTKKKCATKVVCPKGNKVCHCKKKKKKKVKST